MPNKHGTITFSLSDEIKIAIEELAKRRSVSQGAICKVAITKFLEEEFKDETK